MPRGKKYGPEVIPKLREAELVARTKSAEFLCTAHNSSPLKLAQGRVAEGNCSPPAPTDPYVRTLAHTVPQNMVLL